MPFFSKRLFDYLWRHAHNSDETNEGINRYCNFVSEDSVNKKADGYSNTIRCGKFQSQGFIELGVMDLYDIYAPQCNSSALKLGFNGKVMKFDSGSDFHIASMPKLQNGQVAGRHATSFLL
ncbi:hypothetical protein V6N13_065688 [Hibiscus sabdariffa]